MEGREGEVIASRLSGRKEQASLLRGFRLLVAISTELKEVVGKTMMLVTKGEGEHGRRALRGKKEWFKFGERALKGEGVGGFLYHWIYRTMGSFISTAGV